MTRRIAGDDSTFQHQGLAGQDSTLPVLMVNQGQPALVQ